MYILHYIYIYIYIYLLYYIYLRTYHCTYMFRYILEEELLRNDKRRWRYSLRVPKDTQRDFKT